MLGKIKDTVDGPGFPKCQRVIYSSPEAEQQRVREPAASKTLEPLQPEVRTPGTRQNYESFSLSEMCCSQASSSQMEDYQEYPPYEPLEVQLPSFSSIVQTGIEFYDEDAVVDFATMYEIHCYRMLHNVQAGKVNLVSRISSFHTATALNFRSVGDE